MAKAGCASDRWNTFGRPAAVETGACGFSAPWLRPRLRQCPDTDPAVGLLPGARWMSLRRRVALQAESASPAFLGAVRRVPAMVLACVVGFLAASSVTVLLIDYVLERRAVARMDHFGNALGSLAAELAADLMLRPNPVAFSNLGHRMTAFDEVVGFSLYTVDDRVLVFFGPRRERPRNRASHAPGGCGRHGSRLCAGRPGPGAFPAVGGGVVVCLGAVLAACAGGDHRFGGCLPPHGADVESS